MRILVARFLADESGFVAVRSTLLISCLLFVSIATAKFFCAKLSLTAGSIQTALGYVRICRIAWDMTGDKLDTCSRQSERYYVGDPARNVEHYCRSA